MNKFDGPNSGILAPFSGVESGNFLILNSGNQQLQTFLGENPVFGKFSDFATSGQNETFLIYNVNSGIYIRKQSNSFQDPNLFAQLSFVPSFFSSVSVLAGSPRIEIVGKGKDKTPFSIISYPFNSVDFTGNFEDFEPYETGDTTSLYQEYFSKNLRIEFDNFESAFQTYTFQNKQQISGFLTYA